MKSWLIGLLKAILLWLEPAPQIQPSPETWGVFRRKGKWFARNYKRSPKMIKGFTEKEARWIAGSRNRGGIVAMNEQEPKPLPAEEVLS